MRPRSFSVALFAAPLLLNACSASDDGAGAGAAVPSFGEAPGNMPSAPGQPEAPTVDDGEPPVSTGNGNEQVATPVLPLEPTTPSTAGGAPVEPPPVEEPVVEEPVVEEPVIEEPVVEAPPVVEEPVAEEPPPVVEEPPAGAFVENSGQNCQLPALPNANALPSSNTLPDPFLGLDGQRITTRAEWRCRRQEILKLAERFIYGEKPLRPQSVTGTVVNNRITVNVQNAGQTASFNATITLPAGANGPVPAIIGYGGSPFQNNILQEGVAFINYNVDQVGNEATRNPKQGAFYTVNPGNASSGMLVAWAWGVSRMIDVIEASGAQIINPRAIGVTGCSRSGKGAFTAGAFDERVALTIPFESGTTGVPAWRLIVAEGGETPSAAFGYRPWAGDAFQAFTQNQSTLPIDTHEVIGMVAPRGLYVMGNPHIVNLAPRSEHVAVLAGAEIYEALGAAQNITYLSNIQEGAHCVFRNEFVAPLQQNIRKFLKNEANASTGSINAHATRTGNLAPNINWTTPTLE